MGPIDYTLNAANPQAAMLAGLQGGLQVQGMRQEQAQSQQIADAQAAKLAADQQKAQIETAAMQRQQRYMDEMDRMRTEGFNPQKIMELSTFMDKDTAQAMREGAEALSKEQQKNALGEMTGLMSSLTSNKLDVARDLLTTKAEAYRNSGNEAQAKQMESMLAGLEDDDPADVIIGIGTLMSQFPGGKEALDAIGAVQKQPSERKKAEAEATTAGVKAKYAESEALMGLEKAGWDIKAIQNDMTVKKQNSRIYAISQAVARENNALKRQELGLKLEEAVRTRDNDIRAKAAEGEAAVVVIDTILDTADRLLASPGLASALGPIESRIPTMSEDTADAEALIEMLTSQAFLTQVSQMKGMGALTETEGKRLTSALQSLKTNQSEKQFRSNVQTVKTMMGQARQRTKTKYGIPDSEQAESTDDIDALINKYLPGGQ